MDNDCSSLSLNVDVCPNRNPARSVCWIDPCLAYDSPSMVHLLHALPHLREAGWEIEAWCLRSDAPRDQVRHVFLPSAKWLGPIEHLWFVIVANLYGTWRRLYGSRRLPAVIHATCGTYFGANVISVHFVSAVWTAMQIKLGLRSAKEVVKFAIGLPVLLFERLSWWSPTVQKILAVSESTAADVRKRAPIGREIEVLPNSYDETRFHPGVRARYRDSTRTTLGLSPAETAFIFVSQGHYERKGFWLALAALSRLRKAGRHGLRLIVVGGTPKALESLRKRLDVEVADWRQWLFLAGTQREVERYFAAADAFIFPSYYESYALVALEAAAIGLPLLITPFAGSEMTIRDGVNGMLLDYQPERMSAQIAHFLDGGLAPFAPDVGYGLNRRQYADRLLTIYEEMAADKTPMAPSGVPRY
jgi:glycosyltransferase involved in cell wall biosynthesis